MLLVLTAYVAVALVSGALSCFVLWSKLPNYSDGASHAGVLGYALSKVAGYRPMPFVCGSIVLFSILVHRFVATKKQNYDTMIAVVSKGMAAIGIALALATGYEDPEHGLEEVFFGAGQISSNTLIMMCVYSAVVISRLAFFWRQCVLVLIDEDLARVEGIKVERVRWEIILMSMIYIMLLIDTIGMVMISSTLVLPAASARYLSRDYAPMIVFSVGINLITTLLGYYAALQYGIPVGAAIVSVAFVFFVVLGTIDLVRNKG